MFTGFNIFSIALEVPMTDVFPHGIPHNGLLRPTSTDSLLRVWSSISRRETQTVDTNNIITGLKGSGDWVQVGRNALPLFNAGLVGTQRQTLYLHSSPIHDVTNFGADILFPVLVRDAEALGIYAALGVPPATVATLKGPRVDIINAINLGRPIPVADGFTGDVITLDAAIDSSFPNGRRLGGGTAPNRNQVNVNSVLISLIVAGNPAAGLAKGVEVNDKDYLDRFPFLAPAHQGLLQGHGGINVPDGAEHPGSLVSHTIASGRSPFAGAVLRFSRLTRISRSKRTTMMSPSLSSSMLRRLGLLVVTAIVLWRVPLVAHDMWIEPTTFSPEVGQIVSVRLRVGQDLLGDPLPLDPSLVNQFVVKMPMASGRSSAGTAAIRRASCAWRCLACSSSAIAATRAPSRWRRTNSINI